MAVLGGVGVGELVEEIGAEGQVLSDCWEEHWDLSIGILVRGIIVKSLSPYS